MKRRASALWLSIITCAGLAGNAGAQPRPARVSPPAARALAPAAQAAIAKTALDAQKEKTIAIVGARVFTGAGDPIEDGVVIVTGGKIQSVGKGLAAPAGAEVVQARGMVVTPGLTDPLTQVGLREISLEKSANDENESDGKDRIRAAYRAVDGYNPQSTVIPVSRAGGLTSVGVVPTGGLVSGQSAWADLTGDTVADAVTAAPLALHVHLEAGADPHGGSRAATLLAVREAFDDARAFQKNRAAWERNQSRPFSQSRLDLEALTLALGGGAAGKAAARLPVVFHVNRASSIVAALAMAKEFGLSPVIAGGAEAWRVRATLARDKVPVVINPLLAGPESFDEIGARDDNAALLHAAGVTIALSSGNTHNARKLRQAAGNAVRAGLPAAAAIEAITRGPAVALGMSDSHGTIAAGKVANLVVWSGDPLEIQTRVIAVYIRGKKQSLANRQTELLQKYRGVAQ